MDENNLLTVHNLSVVIDKTSVLKDVSFSVQRGHALAIIGPNGAGKTMLFRALLGLIPYQGSIIWKSNIRIGYAPQRFEVEKKMPVTVGEFFLLHSAHFWFPRAEFMQHLAHELTLVGLTKDILAKPLGELSGGQLQRLLISWAMLTHPDILLFDEPTAGVDIGFEETIYQLIHRVQDERQTAILLISHDLNVVYRYAEEVLCLNKKMICHGPPHEVLTPAELRDLYGEQAFYHHLEKT